MKIHCTAKWCRQLLAHFLFLCLTVCELPLMWRSLCLGDFMYLKKFSRSVLLFLVTFPFYFYFLLLFLLQWQNVEQELCVHNTAQQSWQNGRVIYEFCCWLKKKKVLYKLQTLCGSWLHNELCNTLMTAWSEPHIFAWEWVFASLFFLSFFFFFFWGGGGGGDDSAPVVVVARQIVSFRWFFPPFHSTARQWVFYVCSQQGDTKQRQKKKLIS